MPALIPPPPIASELDTPEWGQFFELVRKQLNAPVFYSSAVNPTTADVPNGSWLLWKNTGSGQVRIWANDGGVLKSALLS